MCERHKDRKQDMKYGWLTVTKRGVYALRPLNLLMHRASGQPACCRRSDMQCGIVARVKEAPAAKALTACCPALPASAPAATALSQPAGPASAPVAAEDSNAAVQMSDNTFVAVQRSSHKLHQEPGSSNSQCSTKPSCRFLLHARFVLSSRQTRQEPLSHLLHTQPCCPREASRPHTCHVHTSPRTAP